MKVRTPLFEVCANGLQSAINAEIAGADRIELCENLEVGGVTPTLELMMKVRESTHLPIHVLIRPRAGDFNYAEEEFQIMIESIQSCKKLKMEGVVLGVLHSDLTIDQERTAQLMSLAFPMSVTFHRAFDVVIDPVESLHTLIKLGVNRILTSGQKENALLGSDLISKLVSIAEDKITLLAGGGITEDNITAIVKQSGTHEFHFSAKKQLADNSLVSDPELIRNICSKASIAYEKMH